jgi:hypothetical protein
MVCNNQPIVWKTSHNTFCTVSSALLASAFPGSTQFTYARDLVAGTTFATIWFNNIPQFNCKLSKCAQSFDDRNATWACSDISCKCNSGTKFCGGSSIDLTKAVNAASGSGVVKCGVNNGSDCNVNFGFMSTLFPDGMNLVQCSFGECADQFDKPVYMDATVIVTYT